jgi:hypothetical protein
MGRAQHASTTHSMLSREEAQRRDRALGGRASRRQIQLRWIWRKRLRCGHYSMLTGAGTSSKRFFLNAGLRPALHLHLGIDSGYTGAPQRTPWETCR